MIIIGFVVTVMIFSSFAIVFSNSGNNLNNSNKQILNLPEKSFTSNIVNKYQIDLSNLPSGNGYYQQLIALNNYDTYGINSNGSNIEFFSSNNTQLYAWIQSINSTSMQIWIKNFNQSSILYLYVLQSYENLFSSTGYLGQADTTTDNGKLVFPAYWNAYTSLNEFYNVSGIKLISYNDNGKQVIGLFGYDDHNVPVLVYKEHSLPQGNYIIHSYAEHLDNLSGGLSASNGLVGLYGVDWNSSGFDAEMGSNNQFISLDTLISGGNTYDINGSGSAISTWTNTSLFYNDSKYISATFQAGSIIGTSSTTMSSNPLSGIVYMGAGLAATSSSNYFQSIFQYEFATSDIKMPSYTINQILNLQSGISKTVSISNAVNNPNEPIEFYDNFLLYVNTNSNLEIENLSSGLTFATNITYNNQY